MVITFTNDAGVETIMTLDNKQNTVETIINYPKNYESDYERELKLPITKRTFWNPATESFVSYQRARQLKLIINESN